MSERVIIVGSGPAGAAAALRLTDRGVRPLVLDVGMQPDEHAPLSENVYQLRRRQDLFEVMIGEKFERVEHLRRTAEHVPAKLASPRIRYVLQGAGRLGPIEGTGFSALQSYALGGLANAWGAGLYRFTERDLHGVPLSLQDLSPYYDRLEREIGISGATDDLSPYFGATESMQPALRLSRKAARLLRSYCRRRKSLQAQGVYVGRPRLGVLSQPWNGRTACDYSNLEFWQPDLPHIYTPAMTLRKLARAGSVEYRGGVLVQKWSRSGSSLFVHGTDCASGGDMVFEADSLLLAAGAIGSAKLALQSRGDFGTPLGLLDNPAVQIPMILMDFIGSPLEEDCFGLTQLNLIYDPPDAAAPWQGSILEITSPSRSEFFPSLPFAARDNLRFIRNLVPAMLVMQLFLPADGRQGAKLTLMPGGAVRIDAAGEDDRRAAVRRMAPLLWKLGALTHRALAVYPPAGHGIHYGGSLPMCNVPASPYQCSRDCELTGEPNVYVVDGSVFPRLPAKNYSLTVMANAMRVADRIVERSRGWNTAH